MKFLLVASLILVFQLTNAQQYGWVRVAQIGDQFTVLHAVDFVDSLHGWLYGFRAGYRYTTDGGTNWILSPTEPTVSTAISMVDTVVGWAVGNGLNSAGISKTTDGGRTWEQQGLVRFDRVNYGTASINGLKNITSGSTYGFFPDTGKILQTTNGGTIWTERTVADSITLSRLFFIDSLHGWIIAGARNVPAILRTTDGGQTWVLYTKTPPRNQAISFIDTLRGWAISGNATYAYRTTDAGATWAQLGRIEDPMWGDLIPASISFADSVNGWAFGTMFYQGDLTAVIFRTTDGGLSWSPEFRGGGARGVTGMMLDRWHGWAVGTGGNVFAYRVISGVPERVDRVPKSFALRQNYPNPFNPTTYIEYEVLRRSPVSIAVYDGSGKEIRELVNTEHERGVYRIRFDAQNLASGTYYYTMKTPSVSLTKQMTLLK